jgi:hypothetical protein
MDTGTAKGFFFPALSPLLFILFINALLRLFDHSALHHGVSGAPLFNHLAFADHLSLYLNSGANANRLLTKVHLFEKWSGLRIALPKSFVMERCTARGRSSARRWPRDAFGLNRIRPRMHIRGTSLRWRKKMTSTSFCVNSGRMSRKGTVAPSARKRSFLINALRTRRSPRTVLRSVSRVDHSGCLRASSTTVTRYR